MPSQKPFFYNITSCQQEVIELHLQNNYIILSYGTKMIVKIQHHIMLTSYSATMIDKEGSLLPYHSVSCQPHTWGI